MDLDGYRAGAQRFCTQLGREQFRHFAGLSASFELEALYRRHGELFDAATVLRLRELSTAAAPAQQDQTRCLLAFAVAGHLAAATAAIDAELARLESELTIEVNGARMSLRESFATQAQEHDGDLRQLIEETRLGAVERVLSPLRAQALGLMHSRAQELGWGSYLQCHEQTLAIDLRGLGRQARELLDRSAAGLAAALAGPVAAGAGVRGRELRRSDLPRFHRLPGADAQFPAQRLLGAWQQTLSALGLPEAVSGVKLDVGGRPGKARRAFCSPARVPGEIYLVVAPAGGRDDYAGLLHEGGHALNFASVPAQLAFERRHLGDSAVTEAFAFLFERLVSEPAWLSARLGVRESRALSAHAAAERLLLMRRYAAKLLFELELHDAGGLQGAQASRRYAELLSEAAGVRWPGEAWLSDLDPGFYCAHYLRAWSLEHQLRLVLRERFGARWHEQAAAGRFLRGLWSAGQPARAEHLAGALGDRPLDLTDALAS